MGLTRTKSVRASSGLAGGAQLPSLREAKEARGIVFRMLQDVNKVVLS